DGIRDRNVTGVQTCALPILHAALRLPRAERAHRRAGPEARAEPAQCRSRIPPPEGLVDHRLTAAGDLGLWARPGRGPRARDALGDRKSTRLNSSHVSISYAV